MANTNIGQFFRQVRQEVAKVTWPTRKETGTASFMVFLMVIFSAMFFFFVDQIMALGVRLIFGLGA